MFVITEAILPPPRAVMCTFQHDGNEAPSRRADVRRRRWWCSPRGTERHVLTEKENIDAHDCIVMMRGTNRNPNLATTPLSRPSLTARVFTRLQL